MNFRIPKNLTQNLCTAWRPASSGKLTHRTLPSIDIKNLFRFQVRWSLNDEPVAGKNFVASSVGNRHSLTIAEVTKDDSGVVSCVAENDVGKSTSTAKLVVRGEKRVRDTRTAVGAISCGRLFGSRRESPPCRVTRKHSDIFILLFTLFFSPVAVSQNLFFFSKKIFL